MPKARVRDAVVKEHSKKESNKTYVHPKAASMEEFTLKTAVGVSPAMKKKDTYIVSTLF